MATSPIDHPKKRLVWSKARLSPTLVLLFVQPGCCTREAGHEVVAGSVHASACSTSRTSCCVISKE